METSVVFLKQKHSLRFHELVSPYLEAGVLPLLRGPVEEGAGPVHLDAGLKGNPGYSKIV